jgi:hypothetical protein
MLCRIGFAADPSLCLPNLFLYLPPEPSCCVLCSIIRGHGSIWFIDAWPTATIGAMVWIGPLG